MEMEEFEFPIDTCILLGSRANIDRYRKAHDAQVNRLSIYRRATAALGVATLALSITTAAAFLTAEKALSQAEAPAYQGTIVQPAPQISTLPEIIQTSAAEAPTLLLKAVPLEEDIQRSIFNACGKDVELFCAVMAIANRESRFDPNAVGDSGRSIGMMQINTNAHVDRIESLGVSDLTDIGQNVSVAIDYLSELMSIFDIGMDDHLLYMAYNMGPSAAKRAFESGTTSTEYSREVMEHYQNYMSQAGGCT